MNIGLIMIILGGFFGLVGVIVLIMGIRAASRAKRENYAQNYNNSNYNNVMSNQNNIGQRPQMQQNNQMQQMNQRPPMVNPNNQIRDTEFDPFSESAPKSQKQRVREVEFDPFAEDAPPAKQKQMPDYDNDDFDPFADSLSNIDKLNNGVEPVKKSFSVPKMPNFKDEVDDFRKSNIEDFDAFDNGMGNDNDFDAGMGFDEPMQAKNSNLIDMDEDLEDF